MIYRVLQDTHEELLVTTRGNMKKVNATFHDLIEEQLKTQQQGLVFRLCRSMMRAT